MFTIKRWIELDAGHRVPYHASACRHLHGHRYRVTAVVSAPEVVAVTSRRLDAGMVVDFGVVKEALQRVVHVPHDHKLLLWEQDPLLGVVDGVAGFTAMLDHLGILRGGVVFLPVIPTAEELARWWGMAVGRALEEVEGGAFCLTAFEVRETPTSEAVWTPS